MEIYDLLVTALPAHFNQVLNAGYQISADGPSSVNRQTLAVETTFQGALRGCITVFIPKKQRELLIRQFLLTSVPMDQGDCSDKAICLELVNMVLGHFTEAARLNGWPTEIASPGILTTCTDTPLAVEDGSIHLHLTEASGRLGPIEIVSALSLNPTETVTPAEGNGKARVLIVDDSPVMQAFLEKIFRENGYEVVGTASDGVEAIEMFEAMRPDLMTLDIIMPKLKGTEVLERILQAHPEAKVIMASSVSDARTVMKCLKIGAKRYILKPYDGDAVIVAVEKVLNL